MTFIEHPPLRGGYRSLFPTKTTRHFSGIWRRTRMPETRFPAWRIAQDSASRFGRGSAGARGCCTAVCPKRNDLFRLCVHEGRFRRPAAGQTAGDEASRGADQAGDGTMKKKPIELDADELIEAPSGRSGSRRRQAQDHDADDAGGRCPGGWRPCARARSRRSGTAEREPGSLCAVAECSGP